MKYNNNGTYEDIVVKAVAPGRNSYSSSTSEVYSCDYTNKLTKTSKTTSDSATYSCNYVNDAIEGTELYYNANGTTGDVALSDSAANYNCIEIYYKDNDGYKNSTKIEEPNGATVLLLSGSFAANNCYIKGRNITISDTSIVTTGSSKDNYGQYTGVSSGYSNTNYIYIYKVIGYK